ncbi:flagellar biosynthesis anti-sigma factor FlgM [Ramlibacter tataouinensis]|uniref:flagellar biosynthesis anti-sigma factor FlgM n=1 Tax=Ramlibacter tataouinensis TaxID=94132 RepID=UPI0022F3AD9C|nr:flagellar biosynthesis anti-sigma factor FlgM [Ramlibacter tataouinensis]WBY00588.1 flagellar biosynthesis anti-sigma factor FlgM [Ramlibacter tataouinensis]
MKIDQNVIALKNAAGPAGAPRGKGAAGAPAPGGAVATRLQVGSGGEFDAVRVAQIREAIAAGRYPMDAGRIADGVLASVRELLGKRP